MEKIKKYGLPLYVVWTAISAILIIVYLVVNFGFEKPLTSGYEYFNGIKIESDNLEDSDEIPIIEFNISKSNTNPELNLIEMVITEYTDYEQNSYVRYGVQVVGGLSYTCPAGQTYFSDIKDYEVKSKLGLKAYYYIIDVDGDVRNSTLEEIEHEVDDLDVTAGDVNFKLEVGGNDAQYTYTNQYYSKKGWNAWNEWFENVKTQTLTNEYSIVDVFGYLAKSFSIGESNVVKSFDNVDLDKYFTVTKDNGSGQYYSLKDVTTNHAYFRVKCTYNEIGSQINAKDHSIIGAIAKDVNYSSGVINTSTPYYSTGVELTLMGNEFLPAKHENIDGAILTLSPEFKSYLLSLNNLTLNININLDNLTCDEEVVGIDLSSLGSLKITNLNISSETAQDFYIIGASKHITNATYSSTLNLLNSNGGAYEQGN